MAHYALGFFVFELDPGGCLFFELKHIIHCPEGSKLPSRNASGGSYGLFRRMTGVGSKGEVARPEIVIEGSAGRLVHLVAE